MNKEGPCVWILPLERRGGEEEEEEEEKGLGERGRGSCLRYSNEMDTGNLQPHIYERTREREGERETEGERRREAKMVF